MIKEFKHILVALDGSRLAEAVIPAAISLAQCYEAEITLLHIIEQGAPSSVHGDHHLADATESEEYLREVAAKYANTNIHITWHTHPDAERNVAASMVAHAAELHADLIALCTHGHSGMRDWIWGSIAQQVLKRGSTPVLLVNPSFSQFIEEQGGKYLIQKLLVSLDGGKDTEVVLPFATKMASCNNGRIRLLVVVPTLETIPDVHRAATQLSPFMTQAMLDMERDEAADYLQVMSNRLSSDEYTIKAKVLRGDAEQSLVEEAHNWQPDILIMATHGRAGFDALWSGSIGANIVRRLTIPVLLVRIGE